MLFNMSLAKCLGITYIRSICSIRTVICSCCPVCSMGTVICLCPTVFMICTSHFRSRIITGFTICYCIRAVCLVCIRSFLVSRRRICLVFTVIIRIICYGPYICIFQITQIQIIHIIILQTCDQSRKRLQNSSGLYLELGIVLDQPCHIFSYII